MDLCFVLVSLLLQFFKALNINTEIKQTWKRLEFTLSSRAGFEIVLSDPASNIRWLY